MDELVPTVEIYSNAEVRTHLPRNTDRGQHTNTREAQQSDRANRPSNAYDLLVVWFIAFNAVSAGALAERKGSLDLVVVVVWFPVFVVPPKQPVAATTGCLSLNNFSHHRLRQAHGGCHVEGMLQLGGIAVASSGGSDRVKKAGVAAALLYDQKHVTLVSSHDYCRGRHAII